MFDPGGDVGTLTNLIVNPSAELSIGFGGWAVTSSCTLTQDSLGLFGAKSFRMTRDTSAGNIDIRNSGGGRYAVTAGESYAGAAWFRKVGGIPIRQVRVHLDWLNDAGTRVELTTGESVPTSTTDWVRATVTGEAPTGATKGQIICEVVSAGASEGHRVDGVIVAQATDVPDYFDGDSTGAGSTIYKWTGTAHESTSTRTCVRKALDITPWMHPDGADWGTAEITAYAAEAARGQVPVDYRIPNRTIVIPLTLKARGEMSFADVRRDLQAKVALFQRKGGWLKREVNGVPLYADVVNASLRMGGSWMQAENDLDLDVELTLECVPDFYGQEITLADHATTGATSQAELIFTETGPILGDWPARVRIVVDEDEGADQRGLIWGIRSEHYDSSSTAALAYEAEDLTLLDESALATLAGASGGASNNVVRNQALQQDWTGILSTDIDDVGPMTHQGTYRVWARVRSPTVDGPMVRLVWDIGDMVQPVENPGVSVPGAGQFMLNLGEVRLDPAPIGTHRWRGYIQGQQGTRGGANVSIDKIWIVPADEAYGVLRAPATQVSGLVEFVARDDFTGTTSGGNLNARTPPLGTAWATSGATGDFTFCDAGGAVTNSGEAVMRTAASSSIRWGILGASETTMRVGMLSGMGYDATHVFSAAVQRGVVARWTDASNNVRLQVGSDGTSVIAKVVKTIGGTETVLTSTTTGFTPTSLVDATEFAISVSDLGSVYATIQSSSLGLVELSATDAALATGGSLASGKGGIFDAGDGTNTTYRWYDRVEVTALPPSPAVMYDGQGCEIRTDGVYRKTISGDSAGPVAVVTGDLPRLPPSGSEDRPVQVFVKGSRGDLGELQDLATTDKISARVYYRPSYIFTPDSGT